MPELKFKWGELKAIAGALGLKDEDPEPDAGMILQWLEMRFIVTEELDRVRLFGLDDGDG